MEKKIKAGLVQQSNINDIHANMQRLKTNIEDCVSKGAQLVVLQELHNSLYFCQTEDTRLFDLAESIPGPSTRFFGDIARSLGIVLVTSLFEKRCPRPSCGRNPCAARSRRPERDGSGKKRARRSSLPGQKARSTSSAARSSGRARQACRSKRRQKRAFLLRTLPPPSSDGRSRPQDRWAA